MNYPCPFRFVRQPGRCSARWFGLFVVALSPVVAQSVTPPTAEDIVLLSPFTVSTDQDRGYLAANSVSATRINTPIKELPFAINAFTEQFISDVGARDLFDVVQYAPGVTAAGREFNSGNTRFNIRGFDTSSPQRNGFQGARYVDTVNIERVEIVKGPASLLYGAIEPGGVVNYITKRPHGKRSLTINQQVGTDEFLRTSLDLNVPVVEGKLLARVNAAWEQGFNFADPGKDSKWVVAPTFQWIIAEGHTLDLSGERFSRHEDPQTNFLPNIIVGYHDANPAQANNPFQFRRLTDPVSNTFDPGFLYFFPVPKDFNFAGDDDFRRSLIDSLYASYTGRLGDSWTVRANAAWQGSSVKLKTTGIGDINSYAPGTARADGTLDVAAVPGATTAEKNAYLAAQAAAFAARVLANPRVVLESPFAYQVRRKRYATEENDNYSYQVDLAGDYTFDWGRVRPLVGAFHQYSETESENRQSTANPPAGLANSATTATQHFQPWYYLDLANRPRGEVYDVATIPQQARTGNRSNSTAYYATVNATLLDDRLSTVAGLRRTETESTSINRRTGAAPVTFKEKATTAQLGAGYRVRPDLMVFASYSESFTPVNTNLQLNGVVTGPGQPITSDGVEFGVKSDFLDGRVSSTLSYFKITQSNRISRFSIPDPVTGVTQTSVIQGTTDESEGFELDLNVSPTDNWQVYVSYSNIDARTVGAPPALARAIGTKIENSARHLASLWTRYNFTGEAVKGLWIGGGVNYTGEKQLRINNPDLFFEPTTVLDAVIGYDWKTNHAAWSGTLSWKNLTDEFYVPSNLSRGLPERLILSVSARF